MPQGSQEGLDINAAVVAQEGLDTLAAQSDATEGQVPTVGSDGKVAFAAGGGGSQAPQYAAYSGNYVLIANTDTQAVPWDVFDDGDDLLDVTDPAHPAVRADGIYLVSIGVRCFPLTIGGTYSLNLILDVANGSAEIDADSPAATAAQPAPQVSCSAGYFIPAGHTLEVLVQNNDGASAVDFSLHGATIVRLPI